MKKSIKIISVMAAVCLITVSLSACGQSEKVITGEGNQTSNAAKESSAVTGTQEADGQPQTDTHKGYIFESADVSISVDADAASVIDALGEPISYFEAASCAFEGIDKFYTYSGFEIDTYPVKDKDYISAIVLKDDSVTTPEGLSIGDEAKKVTDLYGEATESTDTLMVYEKDDMKLRIIIKDSEVQAIEYVSLVLE